jgi:chorismate dehydratase
LAKVRLGIPDLLEVRPLVWGFLRGHHDDLFVPRLYPAERVAELLREGEVDAALVSVTELSQLEDVRMVPELCVSVRGSSELVMVQSTLPPADVLSLAVEPTAGAEVELVRMLWRQEYGREPELRRRPRLTAVPPDCDAVMLCSEAALGSAWSEPYRLRPTGWWQERTGLPFVSRVWAVREATQLPDLSFYLKSSLRYGLSSLDVLCREEASPLGGRIHRWRRFLGDQLGYVLGSSEREGLERFLEQWGAGPRTGGCTPTGGAAAFETPGPLQ